MKKTTSAELINHIENYCKKIPEAKPIIEFARSNNVLAGGKIIKQQGANPSHFGIHLIPPDGWDADKHIALVGVSDPELTQFVFDQDGYYSVFVYLISEKNKLSSDTELLLLFNQNLPPSPWSAISGIGSFASAKYYHQHKNQEEEQECFRQSSFNMKYKRSATLAKAQLEGVKITRKVLNSISCGALDKIIKGFKKMPEKFPFPFPIPAIGLLRENGILSHEDVWQYQREMIVMFDQIYTHETIGDEGMIKKLTE